MANIKSEAVPGHYFEITKHGEGSDPYAFRVNGELRGWFSSEYDAFIAWDNYKRNLLGLSIRDI